MPYYEIIYETGTKSIGFYADDAEAQKAIGEHNRRALAGEPGTPAASSPKPETGLTATSWPAERVKQVLIYNEHPGNYRQDAIVSTDELKSSVNEAIDKSAMEGLVHVPTVISAMRDFTSAVDNEAGIHDSMYKAPNDGELDLAFLGGES